MTFSGVQRSGGFEFRRDDSGLADGLEVAVLAGPDTGSVHLEVAMARLRPGGAITGHRHFYEESFYVLEGGGLAAIGPRTFTLEANSFGFVPAGEAHAWRNPGDRDLVWIRVRSPQPRAMVRTRGTYRSSEVAVPAGDAGGGEAHPASRKVGRFEEHHLPAPGPLAMRGYRGPNIDTVSIWMLVDDLIGAQHHTMFVVEFVPGASTHPQGDHFHPFEEAYYFVQGSAIAHLDDGDFEVAAGDLVFAGTNALHGYTMTADVPTRWIEVQAPAPTATGAFIFPQEWDALAD